MKNNFILKPSTTPNYVKVGALRGKFEESEWKYLLFALRKHDIITDTSTRTVVLSYSEDKQLAEYYSVALPALRKKLRALTPCQIEALCTRVYSYWHPDVTYFKVNRHEFIPMNNLMGEPPSEKKVHDICKL